MSERCECDLKCCVLTLLFLLRSSAALSPLLSLCAQTADAEILHALGKHVPGAHDAAAEDTLRSLSPPLPHFPSQLHTEHPHKHHVTLVEEQQKGKQTSEEMKKSSVEQSEQMKEKEHATAGEEQRTSTLQQQPTPSSTAHPPAKDISATQQQQQQSLGVGSASQLDAAAASKSSELPEKGQSVSGATKASEVQQEATRKEAEKLQEKGEKRD